MCIYKCLWSDLVPNRQFRWVLNSNLKVIFCQNCKDIFSIVFLHPALLVSSTVPFWFSFIYRWLFSSLWKLLGDVFSFFWVFWNFKILCILHAGGLMISVSRKTWVSWSGKFCSIIYLKILSIDFSLLPKMLINQTRTSYIIIFALTFL